MTPTIPSKDGKIPPLGLQRKELGPPRSKSIINKGIGSKF